MLNKIKLQETLENFPDKFSVDELIDKVILLDKIERGNLQSEQVKTISEEELDKEIQKWFE